MRRKIFEREMDVIRCEHGPTYNNVTSAGGAVIGLSCARCGAGVGITAQKKRRQPKVISLMFAGFDDRIYDYAGK